MRNSGGGSDPADVTIVTVTYNSADVITVLLDSLPRTVPVVVVDNASTDNTVQLAGSFPNVVVRPMATNKGFGSANNAGARLAETQYLLFVNPDVRLDAGAIPALLAAAERLPQRSAINPRFLDCNGRIQLRAPSRFLGRARGERSTVPAGDVALNVLHGAAIFMRKEHFHEIGGFDENIFLYFEDDDLSLRLLNAGFGLFHAHDAIAHHRGGASTTPSAELTRFKNYHWLQSSLYVAEKYGARPSRLPLGGKLAARWAGAAISQRAAERLKYEGRILGLAGALTGHGFPVPNASK